MVWERKTDEFRKRGQMAKWIDDENLSWSDLAFELEISERQLMRYSKRDTSISLINALLIEEESEGAVTLLGLLSDEDIKKLTGKLKRKARELNREE